MKPLLIDTDPGIDDAVAIQFAIGSGKFDLRAVTAVSGNMPADVCARNALTVLDMAGRQDVPVAQGPLKPLVRPYPRDPFSHGADGLAELGIPQSRRAIDPRFAPDLILETVYAAEGELTILALGPLTNIALALIKEPSLPRRVKELICIGGAFGFHTAGATRATGDNPVSEWNVYVDPEASKLVFEAGFNLTAIGLDAATHPDMHLSANERALLDPERPAAKFLLGVTDFVERRGFGSYCGLIDSLAVAAAIDPDVIEIEHVSVAVETHSPLTLGQTVVDRRVHFRWTNLPVIKAAKSFRSDLFFPLLRAGINASR